MTRSVAGRLLLLVTFTSLAASQIAVPQRVRVDESVMRALRIKKFDPTYPPSARSARIQGAVALQIQINKSGGVQDIALLSGHPMLAPAAVEAVKQWQYKSYVLNGELVEVETTVTLNFKLPKESAAEGVVRDAPGSPRPGPIVGVISLSPLLPSSGSVPHPIGISTPLAQTLLVTKVNPEYPPEAKSQHIEGEVVLQIVIDEDGDVYDAVLISGHPMLAPAVVDAVKQWKYKPYLLGGRPVDAQTIVRVNFSLSENPLAEGVVGDAPGGIPPGGRGGITSSAPVDADRPGVVRVSQGVMSGLLVSKAPPEYPADAKQARIQGTVVVRVVVDKEGSVSSIQLISGHPLLAPAAIEAVREWKYKPYLLNGAAAVLVRQPMNRPSATRSRA